jgi:hypothetical protein
LKSVVRFAAVDEHSSEVGHALDSALLVPAYRDLRQDSVDIVVGTRNADGGSMGAFPEVTAGESKG